MFKLHCDTYLCISYLKFSLQISIYHLVFYPLSPLVFPVGLNSSFYSHSRTLHRAEFWKYFREFRICWRLLQNACTSNNSARTVEGIPVISTSNATNADVLQYPLNHDFNDCKGSSCWAFCSMASIIRLESFCSDPISQFWKRSWGHVNTSYRWNSSDSHPLKSKAESGEVDRFYCNKYCQKRLYKSIYTISYTQLPASQVEYWHGTSKSVSRSGTLPQPRGFSKWFSMVRGDKLLVLAKTGWCWRNWLSVRENTCILDIFFLETQGNNRCWIHWNKFPWYLACNW